MRWISAILVCVSLGGVLSCHRVPDGQPDQWIEQGWAEYRAGEFAGAASLFESAANAAQPGSETRLRATYGLATTWNLRRPDEDPALARQLYGRIIDEAPKHDLAAWALLALARMHHVVAVGQEPDRALTDAAYQRVIDHWPNHPAADEAFVYQQSLRLVDLDPTTAKESIGLLNGFLSSRADSKQLSQVHSLLSAAHATLGEHSASLSADIQALERREVDPTNPFLDRSNAYWRIATTAEFDVGDFEIARRFYLRFLDEYPTDQRAFGARQAMARMTALEQSIAAEVSR